MINDSINRFLGVLCYPFISMDEFRQNLMGKYIESCGKADRQETREIKKRLKSQVIAYIRKYYNLYSYDEIYLYLEKCYLYDACDPGKYRNELELYQDTMKKMASSLISHRDGRIVFKYWRNKADAALFGGFAGNNKVNLFHSLNSHIPMDVIAIVYMLENQKPQSRPDLSSLDNFYGNIEVADQQLSRVLEEGVAENHLHKGVSRTFSSIWDSMMQPLTTNRSRKYFYDMDFVDGTREQNRQILFYILGCGLVRAYLALRMGSRKIPEDRQLMELLRCFLQGDKFEDYYREHFCSRESEKENKGDKKEDREKDNEILSHYIALWNILARALPKNAFRGDMCRLILEPGSTINTLDENIFLYHALLRLMGKRQEEQNDEGENIDIKKYIMQYLRVRNYLFHISVQKKTVKGLDYFQQNHYRLNSGLNRVNTDNFWEVAIREQLQNRDLHKIEFRTSMPEKVSDFKREVKKFLEAYQTILKEDFYISSDESFKPYRRIPQVGLVVHFLKKQDESAPEKCFQNGKGNCEYFRFGKLARLYEQQISAFTQLRNENRELSRYLVGIDAASLENSTPVWVFAPVYEKARDSSIEGIGREGQDGDYIQSLGFTFHAGEDFRHILSGLRRIDEAVEFLKFHAGDRIGHGIALGIPAEKWKAENPVIVLPQIEALENYLWAYDTMSRNYSGFQAAVLAYLEKRIFELSGRIYGGGKSRGGKGDGDWEEEEFEEYGEYREYEGSGFTGIPVEILIAGYHRQFCPRRGGLETEARIVEAEFCQKVCSGEKIAWNARLLDAARHCKKYVREMERPVHYEITEQDLLIIEQLQQIMKKKLSKKGIVIEVNPSSNTAIANLDTVEENQLFQLSHIDKEDDLIVCINSDDPAVFNTNVSNELAYIYYGMLEKNIGREAALRWIDRVRVNGLNSSFIRHREPDQILLERLDTLIKSL